MSKIVRVCNKIVVSSFRFQVSSLPLWLAIIWIFLLFLPAISISKENIIKGYDLRGEWKFLAKDDPAFAQNSLDDSAWDKVTLPENEKTLKSGWYRYT